MLVHTQSPSNHHHGSVSIQVMVLVTSIPSKPIWVFVSQMSLSLLILEDGLKFDGSKKSYWFYLTFSFFLVLGLKPNLRSCTRQASTLYHWTTPPAQLFFVLRTRVTIFKLLTYRVEIWSVCLTFNNHPTLPSIWISMLFIVFTFDSCTSAI